MQLAQHKVSKTEWVTTPCRKLTWGNQETIWPLSYAALCAIPTERIQHLAKHKRDFSAWENESSRKVEEGRSSRSDRPASKTIQYEDLVRLSTPKYRSRSSQEIRLPHTAWCERSCPIWHVDGSGRPPALSPRLLQLAVPKRTHPEFKGNRELVETYISNSAKSAHTSPRVDQLSRPKTRESNMFFDLGYPEEPIRPVSKYARRATASPRIKSLAIPKGVVKDYVPLRDPIWIPPRAIRTAEASVRTRELG
ncbi:hypothetical protein MATL_G00197200 [Megalops atlanticus]|uniref:Testicular haploid expressed protein n=1 Tax=Megalops atlanticus TaxID=7932 RepID=A0A9D3PJU9_MEGAT|nr:hypothetical protein MATL_G00197200 [Megalops atlanticus]